MGWWLIALVVLLWWAFGPWTFVLVGALLLVPRVRERVPRPHITRKGVGITGAVVAAVALLVVVIPDGVLPMPGTGGIVATPSYDGRQVAAEPLDVEEPSQHPWLAEPQIVRPGPLGDGTTSDSAWYGLESCRGMQFTSAERLIALCSDRRGPVLRVLDADSMRPLATKRLPGHVDTDDAARADACSGLRFYLDNGDRVVVTTTDNRIQSISTADADGEADLTVGQSWDLDKLVGEGDCLVRAMADWSGRIWWASYGGRVGMIDTVAGSAKVLELEERITQPFSVDESGVFLTTDRALYRLVVDERGAAAISWRTEYDLGAEVKSGQLVQGSGSGTALVDGNLVAIADNAEPRLHVAFHDRSTGAEVCRSAVFDGGESSTETMLVPVGSGVVVTNDHGGRSGWSSVFGFAATGGIARVDHAAGACRVAWTSDAVGAGIRPVVSWATGLVYTHTKRPTAWGVSAWYLTALDARTGKRAFEVRTGTGFLAGNHDGFVVLGPKSGAYVGVRGGVVRVRDAERN